MYLIKTKYFENDLTLLITDFNYQFLFLIKQLSVIIQRVVQQDVNRINGGAHWATLRGFLMSKIKPVFKCDEHFKNTFGYSQCLLTISVGQEVHEDDKLFKTIELVNNTFQSCVLMIDDTLQRHSMAIETDFTSGDALLDVSREAGQNWLVRNREAIKQLTIPHKTVTWDAWLNHPKFNTIRNDFYALYDWDSIFKVALDNTIDEFLIRYDRRDVVNNYFYDSRVRRLCREYLIEECTAMCLWPTLNCQFEVYPSRRNAVMTETHKRFILPKHPNLLHAVRVKFKNKNQLRPQNFEVLDSKELLVVNT